ncbi:hypothetical protein F5Y10DRAFT_113156 [Nemania abortiva]|nr:hypothetical protein F5Y10DRAFT_113156 [Nemania abortiva]
MSPNANSDLPDRPVPNLPSESVAHLEPERPNVPRHVLSNYSSRSEEWRRRLEWERQQGWESLHEWEEQQEWERYRELDRHNPEAERRSLGLPDPRDGPGLASRATGGDRYYEGGRPAHFDQERNGHPSSPAYCPAAHPNGDVGSTKIPFCAPGPSKRAATPNRGEYSRSPKRRILSRLPPPLPPPPPPTPIPPSLPCRPGDAAYIEPAVLVSPPTHPFRLQPSDFLDWCERPENKEPRRMPEVSAGSSPAANHEAAGPQALEAVARDALGM